MIECKNCGSGQYEEVKAGPHISAYCKSCGCFIKHLPQNKPITIHFGKYKGCLLDSLKDEESLRYLTWLANSGTNLKPALKVAIMKHLRSV